MKHLIIINLTSEELDSSFSQAAEMTGATVNIGWRNGAPISVSNPDSSFRTQNNSIPTISDLLSIMLKGFTLEQIMSLEFVVIGGNEEIKHWLAYISGRWNITCTFWFETSQNNYMFETIRPGANDNIVSVLAI